MVFSGKTAHQGHVCVYPVRKLQKDPVLSPMSLLSLTLIVLQLTPESVAPGTDQGSLSSRFWASKTKFTFSSDFS